MERIELNETDKSFKDLKKEWLEFQPKTEEELFQFIHKLTEEYVHDYGTCVHACVALMKAVFDWFDSKEGMTGFQVGLMKWFVLKEVFRETDAIGMRLDKYTDLLFPQLLYKLSTIELDDWQRDTLKKMAMRNIKEAELKAEKNGASLVHPEVLKHWKKLATGWLPRFVVKKKVEEKEVEPN